MNSVFYLDLPSDHRNSTSSLLNSGHNSSTSSLDQQPAIQQIHLTNNNHQPTAPQTKHRVLTNILTKIRKQDSKSKNDDESGRRCSRCKELEDQIITLQDDLNAFENELFGNKEVIKLLQSQIEQIIAEKETYERLCRSLTIEGGDNLDDLITKECELSKIQIKLKQTENQLISYKDENVSLKAKITKSKDEIKLLEEMLQIKDQTVIGLTNEIFDLEKGGELQCSRTPSSFHSYLTANSFPSNETYVKPQLPRLDENEREKLKDSVTAFQAQNQFLNKEIIELNESKKQYEVKLQKLEWTIIEWEAKCCQIQSKLLSLLKEINHIDQEKDEENKDESNNADKAGDEQRKSIAHNESIKQLVQRLLDENSLDIPMSWRRTGNKKNKKENMIIEYDELGFQNKLSQDISEFEDLFSNNTSTTQLADLEDEKQWKERWDNFISSISNSEQLNRTSELKHLLRSGVPQDYRPKIWRMCINRLIEHKKPASDPNYYSNLVKANQRNRKYNPALKQIELDLLRTLPNNKNFESKESDGIMRLRRVLTAYSQRNPVVNYCQGMNRLAAVALLFLNEEDSFWCLVAIIECIMPKDYYTQSLLGAHVDQYVLKDLIAEKLPNLHIHFEKYGIEISLFSWFLTCFIDNLPVKMFLRIWDAFLFEGSKVLFRFSLAFLKYHENNLLSLTDMMTINQYLRVFGEKTYDIKQLCNIAFNVLNPFPMSKIKAKREIYRLEVSKELEKLENLKHTSDSDKTIDSQSD